MLQRNNITMKVIQYLALIVITILSTTTIINNVNYIDNKRNMPKYNLCVPEWIDIPRNINANMYSGYCIINRKRINNNIIIKRIIDLATLYRSIGFIIVGQRKEKDIENIYFITGGNIDEAQIPSMITIVTSNGYGIYRTDNPDTRFAEMIIISMSNKYESHFCVGQEISEKIKSYIKNMNEAITKYIIYYNIDLINDIKINMWLETISNKKNNYEKILIISDYYHEEITKIIKQKTNDINIAIIDDTLYKNIGAQQYYGELPFPRCEIIVENSIVQTINISQPKSN